MVREGAYRENGVDSLHLHGVDSLFYTSQVANPTCQLCKLIEDFALSSSSVRSVQLVIAYSRRNITDPCITVRSSFRTIPITCNESLHCGPLIACYTPCWVERLREKLNNHTEL